MQSNKPIQSLLCQSLNFDKNTINIEENEKSQGICKFCYLSQDQSGQKLISPCGCSGSLKYVHKQCLQMWIKTQADRKGTPLASIYRIKRVNTKCRLCQKDIVFQKQQYKLIQIVAVIQLIAIIYYVKKLKYYICISIIGSFAMNYYFLRFCMKNVSVLGSKIKDHSMVSLIILSLFFILLEQTFIEVKWNTNNLQLSIPYLRNK